MGLWLTGRKVDRSEPAGQAAAGGVSERGSAVFPAAAFRWHGAGAGAEHGQSEAESHIGFAGFAAEEHAVYRSDFDILLDEQLSMVKRLQDEASADPAHSKRRIECITFEKQIHGWAERRLLCMVLFMLTRAVPDAIAGKR